MIMFSINTDTKKERKKKWKKETKRKKTIVITTLATIAVIRQNEKIVSSVIYIIPSSTKSFQAICLQNQT